MASLQMNLESQESPSPSEGSSDVDGAQDDSDECDEKRKMLRVRFPNDYARKAGEGELEVLDILGFDMNYEGVKIRSRTDQVDQHGIDDKGFLLEDILKNWGVKKDKRGKYPYDGMWGLGKAAEKAGELSGEVQAGKLSAEAVHKTLKLVIAKLAEVEGFRQKDIDKCNKRGPPTTSCLGRCTKKGKCGCNAVRIYNNHKFQKEAIEQSRARMSSLLRNLPEEDLPDMMAKTSLQEDDAWNQE
ncbi:hypothetical protein T484DRAFT_1982960 [Baffinella frigidus]|nr:hypothetical protein T484DRAFT_1982960 [Cryptophyta sp. CCMP2293]